MSLDKEPSQVFQSLVQEITEIGKSWHQSALVQHALLNKNKIKKTIRQVEPLQGEKANSCLVISAGPSVHKQRSIQKVVEQGFAGTVVAVDGAYISCLKAGLVPDFVVTLDPHVKRIVRWFGDPNIIENSKGDDYFERQDLDISFREDMLRRNQENIDLVNRLGKQTRAVVCSSAPPNVVERLGEAHFDAYWWNPLVDNPKDPNSLTRHLYSINELPCMNTGGTVGTAAWVFAATILKIPRIGAVGMDLGYYSDLPIEKTQTYYELVAHVGTVENIKNYFCEFEFPLTGEKYYTDPTYYWYRKNLLELLEAGRFTLYNCTEGGTLFGDRVKCLSLLDFLNSKS